MLSEAIGPPIDDLWLWLEGDTILVNIGALLSWIRTLKKRKTRKGTTVLIFCRELHRILWTVRFNPKLARVLRADDAVGGVLVRMRPRRLCVGPARGLGAWRTPLDSRGGR